MTPDIWQQLAIDPPAWMTDETTVAEHPFQPAERAWPPVLMRDVIYAHPAHVAYVTRDTLVSQVLDFLADGERHVVAVVDDFGELDGIVLASDIQDALNQFGCDAFGVSLTEIMDRTPWTCSITDSPHVVLAAMDSLGRRRAPVISEGRVVGCVAPRDIMGTLNDMGEPI